MADLTGIMPSLGAANLGQAQGDQALARVRASQGSKSTDKVEKAARDFEAILLGQWLEQAQKTFSAVPGSDDDDQEDADPGKDEFKAIAMQSLAASVAASGGIGIAKMISRQLHKADGTAAPGGTPEVAGTTAPGTCPTERKQGQ